MESQSPDEFINGFYQPRSLDRAPKPSGDDYRSDFEAPEFTVADRQRLGKKIITTVILEGEIVQFEKTDPRLL